MSDLREAQLRQEFRSEIMRGYQAALCNSDVPGWTLGDEVGKVADNLLASLAAHPVEPAATPVQAAIWCTRAGCEMEGQRIGLEHIHVRKDDGLEVTDDGEYQERIRLARVAAGSWKPAPAPAPARVEIADDPTTNIAYAAYRKHLDSGGVEFEAVRAALEAAPFLQPQPVDRPLLDREQLAAAVDPEAFDGTRRRSSHPAAVVQWAARQLMAYKAADAMLALLGGVDESAPPSSPPLVCTNCEATDFACTACGARKEDS